MECARVCALGSAEYLSLAFNRKSREMGISIGVPKFIHNVFNVAIAILKEGLCSCVADDMI